jgi:hypothetical protein
MKLFVNRGVSETCITDFTSCTVSALRCGLRKSEGISIQLTIIKVADSYWEETTGEKFYSLPGTAWIRLSTGKLCMDVGNGYESCANTIPFFRPWPRSELPSFKLTANNQGDKLISTLELDEFYSMVAYSHSPFPTFASSTAESIPFPSICNPYWDRAHSKPNGLHAIPTEKHLTVDDLYIAPWYTGGLPQEVLPTGWTRCAYGCFAPSFSNNCSVGLIIQSVTHVCSQST